MTRTSEELPPAVTGGARVPSALLQATLCAVVAALLARHGGVVGSAAAIAAAAVWTMAQRRGGPWLLAIPAALTAAAGGDWPPPPASESFATPSTFAGPVWIDGEVAGPIRFDPATAETELRLRPHGSRTSSRLIATGELSVLPGDRLCGMARLTPPSIAGNGRALLFAPAATLQVTRGAPTWQGLAAQVRLRLQRALLDAVPGEAGLLLCHLVLGSGPRLPIDLSAAHRATGLTHLLAVSGAHASMLACLLALGYTALTGRAALSSRRFRWFGASFLLCYGAVTGMEPPVFRALAAFLLILWARAAGRRTGPGTLLAAPALLTAVCAPADLFGVSFNLSYAAVLGLTLAGAFHAHSWRQRYLVLPLWGSLWATLLTTPLTLLYFGQLAPWTILATPLLAPVVAGMLAGGLLVAVLQMFAPPDLVALAAAPLGAATELYCLAVRGLDELPATPILAFSQPDPLALLAAGLLGTAALLAWPGRAGVAVLCVTLSAPHFLPARTRPPRLELAAVGHGQACFAQLPDGTSLLVDCGQLGRGSQCVKATVASLRPRRTIDLLVLTHAHHDHAGGVPRLLEQTRVTRALLPVELTESALAQELRAHGAVVTGVAPGRMHFEVHPGVVLSRPPTAADAINDGSIWVRLEFGTFSAVVTGDALEAGVAAWLEACQQPQPTDVLVLPHHGRHNAEVPRLLRALRPHLALVSNRARPGWTAQALLARGLGVRVLETGRVGTITIEAGEPVTVRTQQALLLR